MRSQPAGSNGKADTSTPPYDAWLATVAARIAPTRTHHPGIRLGSGRAGRPSKKELASFKRFLSQLTIEDCERLGYCDCGEALDGHPPLPKVKPLASWHAARSEEPSANSFRWDGAPIVRPKVAAARRARGRKFEFRPRHGDTAGRRPLVVSPPNP